VNHSIWRLLLLVVGLALILPACREEPPSAAHENFAIRPEGFTYYAAGGVGFPLIADNLFMQVNSAGFLAQTISENEAHLIISLELANARRNSELDANQIVLVDDFNQTYAMWENYPLFPGEIQFIQSPVPAGEVRVGQMVFRVPISALENNLRVRLDSEVHEARLEVFLGDVTRRVMPGES
jgi:hypothetical protein